MTNPTPHGQEPEALRLAQELDAVPDTGADPQTIQEAAAVRRRLHAYCQELEAQVILDCMTHVQNPAEIEHVAWDVSKNGAEMNTTGAVLTHKQAVGSKNCMQCCVSYMLGLPLESVPDFATDGGWELFSEFVESKGYAAVMLPGNHEFEADYLASGTTERGTPHMVVMNDGKPVHDPHPSNAGLVEVQCVWLLAKRATPRAVHADEQEAFEAVAKADTSNVSFIRDDTGYVDMTAALLWHGWKLRASHGQASAQAAPVRGTPADLPPLPDPDLRDVGTTPGGIKEFLRGYATEYAKAALAARAPADSVLEDAAQVEIDLFNDLNRISGNTLTAYAKEMCRLGYRKPTQPASKEKQMNTEIDDSIVLDAMRYRWLRHGDNDEKVLKTYTSRPSEPGEPTMFLPRNDELDRLIDAARAAQEGNSHD